MYKYISILLVASLANISNSKAEIPIDSIGVENLNGKKLIIHKIVARDTYYSVGRRYNVSPKEIMNYNDNKYLGIGTIIKIPTLINFSDIGGSGPSNASGANSGDSPAASQQTEHVVKAKENLSQIAGKYGTTVNEIKRMNKLSSSNLFIGQILLVPGKEITAADTAAAMPAKTPPAASIPVGMQKPATAPATPRSNPPATAPANAGASTPVANRPSSTAPVNTPSSPASAPAAPEQYVEHIVKSNETMYSIATTYHMTMDQLKAKNNITGNSLRVGQKLVIRGQYPPVPEQGSSVPLATGDTTLKDPSLRGAPSKYGLNQVDEKGTAAWITDPDLDPFKMLVLHRSAPIGTIVKVTNPMTNRSTFAKVVGKFTENESTKDVIIVMTKAVAESIGALDKRFFCNLTYSGQDVEQQQ
jgi:peptidoglycan endopeptidase LytF